MVRGKRSISFLLVLTILMTMLVYPPSKVHAGFDLVGNIAPMTDDEGNTTFKFQGGGDTGRVYLAGDFNTWAPSALELSRGENNLYSLNLNSTTLPYGDWGYKFVLENGNWQNGSNLFYQPIAKPVFDNQGNVTFTFFAKPEVERVYLAGSWDNWKDRKELSKVDSSNKFTITLGKDELPAGSYQYKYIYTPGKEAQNWYPNNNQDIIVNELTSIEGKVSAYASANTVEAGNSVVIGANIENVTAREIHIDATNLGGSDNIDVSTNLKERSIDIKPDVDAGPKEVKVSIVDTQGKSYESSVTINVTANTDTEDKLSWDEEIIYFIVTDRFLNGNPSNDPASTDKNHLEAYHGGDFQGIINKVDHLKKLGVSTVWITPIVENMDNNLMADKGDKQYAYHGYWAKDFTKLDPSLGDIAKLEEMIDVLHANGIKIMIDIVVNHSGYGAEDVNPDLKGMFREVEGDSEPTKRSSDLPDFITEDPEISAKVVGWQADWIKKLHKKVDYFRIDTVRNVEHETWQRLKNEAVKIKPDFKMIGEYYEGKYNDNGGYLATGMMDSILDFDFNNIAKSFIDGNVADVENALKARNEFLSRNITVGQFLSSHDEPGFLAHFLGGNKSLMKVAASLQLTAKGQPVIYYGEEIGQSGEVSKWDNGIWARQGENRYDFDWSKVTDENDMLNHYKKLVKIRRDYASLFARGDRKTLYTDSDVTVFSRDYNDQTLIVAINRSNESKKVSFNYDTNKANKFEDLYDNKHVEYGLGGRINLTVPANNNGGTAILLPSLDDNIVTSKLKVHLNDPNNTGYGLWVWPEGVNGAFYRSEASDDFGQVFEIEVADTYNKFGVIVQTEDGNKNIQDDRYANLTNGKGEIWLRVDDENVYYQRPLTLEEEPLTIKNALMESFKTIVVTLNKAIDIQNVKDTLKVIQGKKELIVEKIEKINGNDNATDKFLITLTDEITLEKTINVNFSASYKGEIKNLDTMAIAGNIYDDPKFDEYYKYEGELGNFFDGASTEFRIWAPTATDIKLVTFENDVKSNTYDMARGDKGVYSYKLQGDRRGLEYMYEVSVNGKTSLVVDPYAKAVSVNGERSVVATPNPSSVKRPSGADMKNPIIYELQVRDYSINPNSGMENKSNFLALTEEGTKATNGQITGLDYLKSLGVTHIQLLPIYDFSKNSVDELNEEKYNWGYDPVNYNAVEGSYSTNPKNPFNRIEELQTTIDTLHDNNMGVIMDVVYNHVFSTSEHAFDYIVPGYYFRLDEKGKFRNGTGVGNEIYSERSMVRKYIVDSTKYWANTFNLDGFRFDLMGILDVDTINQVYEEVSKINPNIFILGEGWNMGYHPNNDGANQQNANKMPNIAFFSDTIRDGIRGNNDPGMGYVNGAHNKEKDLIQDIKGGYGRYSYLNASQVIQYIEAHDNYTVWDQIRKTMPNDTEENALKRLKIATAIPMFSFGTPFIHAGQEFARTKGGNHNSYNAPDTVNQFDWDRVLQYSDNVDYVRELIKIRKAYPIFNLKEYDEINNIFEVKYDGAGGVGYRLENGNQDLYIAHNILENPITLNVANGTYNVLVKNQKADANSLETVIVTNNAIEVPALSTLVLVEKEDITSKTYTIHFPIEDAKEQGYKVHFFTNNDQGMTLEFDGKDENNFATASFTYNTTVTRAGFIVYKKELNDANKVGTTQDRNFDTIDQEINEAWVYVDEAETYYVGPDVKEEKIAYNTEYVADDTLEYEKKDITIKGEEGVEKIISHNNKEISRIIIKNAKDEKVSVGNVQIIKSEVPYEKETIEDKDMYIFETKVTKGENGEDTITNTYIVDPNTGNLTDKESVTTRTKPVVNEISTVGTKVANKTDLDNLIKESDALDTSNKTQESIDEFNKALDIAKDVNVNQKVKQEDVDKALEDLKNAKDGLKNKPTENEATQDDPIEDNPTEDDKPSDVVYTFIDGINATLTKKDNNVVIFRVNGPLDEFIKLYVDNEFVPENSYEKREGSTIITLNDEFIESLEEGMHVMLAVFTNGSATVNFNVASSQSDNEIENNQDAGVTSQSTNISNTDNKKQANTKDNQQKIMSKFAKTPSTGDVDENIFISILIITMLV